MNAMCRTSEDPASAEEGPNLCQMQAEMPHRLVEVEVIKRQDDERVRR